MQNEICLDEKDLVQPSIPSPGVFKVELTASGARKALVAKSLHTGVTICISPEVFKAQIDEAARALLAEDKSHASPAKG